MATHIRPGPAFEELSLQGTVDQGWLRHSTRTGQAALWEQEVGSDQTEAGDQGRLQ